MPGRPLANPIVAVAAAVALTTMVAPARAQQSAMAEPVLTEGNGVGVLMGKSVKAGPGSLTAEELVDLWVTLDRTSTFGDLELAGRRVLLSLKARPAPVWQLFYPNGSTLFFAESLTEEVDPLQVLAALPPPVDG